MQKILIEKLSGFPQKLTNLQWLEEELHDLNQDDMSLGWNCQRKCIEHRFSDDWDVEYAVLQHWADHVGARFNITDEANNEGYYSAFIYA
ncbi:MAG: hypothetical protein U9Q62_00100 [Campylobacterota bacterium]|nr:hypothetical protein [Campylobacterota bacterium]